MSGFVLNLARRFEPRHLAIVLVATVASFAMLDLVYRHVMDSLIAFQLEDSDPAARNAFSAMVVAVLLFAAAGLAFAADRLSFRRGARVWHLAALLLVFFGIEAAIGIHTWIQRHEGVSWNIAYLPFLGVASVVWFEAVRAMAANRTAQMTFALGVVTWLAAGLFDAARTGRASALPAGELLEMISAGLLLLGIYAFARGLSLAADPPAERRALDLEIARSAVARVNVRSLVIGIGCLAVVFGILGAIVYPGGGDLRVFDLNKEQTFPAMFSGILLLGAGALALLNGVVRCSDPRDRRWWLILALVFAFLGIDEIAALHEAVQDRVHVWGQATLIPIVIAGVTAWWKVLMSLRPQRDAARLFLLGAAAWVASQGIDLLFNEHYGWTIVPEELCEMLGSALFGLALLVAVRELAAVAAPAARRTKVAPARRAEAVTAQ
jgi:hypothetical protein